MIFLKTQVLKHLQQGIPLFCHKLRGTFVRVSVRPTFFSSPKMCKLIITIKILLAPEGNVLFVPVQQDYLLFIVNKLATFCVTFLTEVKKKKEEKNPKAFGLSLVCRNQQTK